MPKISCRGSTVLLASALDMEEARRRNVNATDLAMKPIAFDPDKLPQRAGFELKVDGIGLLDVNGHLQSLEGVPFDAAMHLAHELERIREAFGTDIVLHGEFFEPDGFNATLSAFRSGKSKAGAAVIWDAVTLKAWHGFEQTPHLHERHAMLQAAFSVAMPRMVRQSRLISLHTTAIDYLEGVLDEALVSAQSYAVALDGIVIKDMDAPYVRGPSPYWLKMKPNESIDVVLQSVRMDGERVKSLVVTFEGKPLVVGSGLSEELRASPDEFWSGRIVEIKHVGRDERGQLRGCSFVRFRDDKEGARA
jgi:ATP-dependent DNA ligase